ncbi:MAG TPA: hypothetical protein VHC69_09045 [Polyangiaceae bacterium]|nr:hypothetical protein [Polyangiaceae bacterium]
MNFGRWLVGSTLVVFGCGRTPVDSERVGCTTDRDCKGERICVQGSCEDRALPDASGGHSSGGGAPAGGSSSGGATASVSSGGSSATGGAADSAVGVTVGRVPVRLDVGANALVVDPLRGKLYAVVRSDAPAHANELVVIDAQHAAIETSVPIGPEPDTLAISDDATRLWVGLHGIGYPASGKIREVDLTKWPPEPGNEYAVPALSYDPSAGAYAARMVVLPGRPESVGISLDCVSCGLEELVIVDAGIPRPNRASRDSASELTVGPPGYLFAFDDIDTGYEFSTITVDDAGATQSVHSGLIYGSDNKIAYGENYVVASSGHVLDVSSPDSPLRLGTFAYAGEFVLHAEHAEVLMLSYAIEASLRDTRDETNPLVFRSLNLSTFRADREEPLAGSYAFVHDLVEVTPDVLPSST